MTDLDTPGSGAQRQVDPDLIGSCIGWGVMYPHVWEVVRRYILRGDDNFQAGGLWILSALVRNLPLQESAATLEEYFAQHDFVPLQGNRPNIMLPALQAAYAVGTTPSWFDDDVEERRARMIALLEKCLANFRSDDFFTPDRAAVRDTIEALRTDRAGFQSHLSDGHHEMSPDEPYRSDVSTGDTRQRSGIPLAGIEVLISARIDQLRDELQPTQLNQMDVVLAKHGYELLDQRVGHLEEKIKDSLASVQRDIDRYVAGQQLSAGRQQVTVSRQTLVLTVVGVLVGMAAIGVPVLLAR